MWDLFLANLVPLFSTLYFGLKFLIIAFWYRCTSAGNIIERSNCVFWIRQVLDLFLYIFIAYVIHLEGELSGQTCSDVSIEEKLSHESISIVAKSSPKCDMFLASVVGLKQTVISVRLSHFWFAAILIVKEILIYW